MQYTKNRMFGVILLRTAALILFIVIGMLVMVYADNQKQKEKSILQRLDDLEKQQARVLIYKSLGGWERDGKNGETFQIHEMDTYFTIAMECNLVLLLQYHAHQHHNSLHWALEKKIDNNFKEVIPKKRLHHESRNNVESFFTSRTLCDDIPNLSPGEYRLKWYLGIYEQSPKGEIHPEYSNHLILLQFPIIP